MESQRSITSSLPPEIIEQILLPLPLDDILRFCHIIGKRIYDDRQFWINKLDYEFGSKDIRPSVYINASREDGLGIYRLFASGFKMGIDIMVEREHLDVADWLFARGERVDSGIDSNIYRTVEWTQYDAIEWLVSRGKIPNDDLIMDIFRDSNHEFIRILLAHGVHIDPPSEILIYFTNPPGEREPEHTDPLLDINMFEVLIQNGIFPQSYMGAILYPSYVKMLERNHISPFQDIKFINEYYSNPELFLTPLEHGVFPSEESILYMHDSNKLDNLKLISKFVSIPPHLIEWILESSFLYGSLDIIEWCAQQGVIPNTEITDKVLERIMSRNKDNSGGSYKMLEWLLQHNIYPSPRLISFLVNQSSDAVTERERILSILSEYGVYPPITKTEYTLH